MYSRFFMLILSWHRVTLSNYRYISINDQTWCSRNTAFLKTWKNGDLPKRVPFCKSNDRDFVISVNSGFCEVPSNGIATSRWTFCTSLTHFFHPSPVSNLGFSGFVLHGLVWKSGIPFYPLPGHWRGIPHLQINPFRSYGCLLIEERHEKHISRVYRHCWRNELIFQYFQHVHPVYHNFSVFSPINITIISPLFSTNDIFFTANDGGKLPWLEEGDEGAVKFLGISGFNGDFMGI